MLNPLKLEVEGSSVNMANNVGENCYIVKHLTNNLTNSFIRCLYVKMIKYTKHSCSFHVYVYFIPLNIR